MQKKSNLIESSLICNISSSENRNSFKNLKVDPELYIKRLQNIEQARLRQEAALNAAKEKYLEEKRLVS